MVVSIVAIGWVVAVVVVPSVARSIVSMAMVGKTPISGPCTSIASVSISSIAIASIVSISSGLGSRLSLPLAKVVVSMTVAVGRVVAVAIGRVVSVSTVAKVSIATIAVVGISTGLGYSCRLSLPLAKVVSSITIVTSIGGVSIAIAVVAVTMAVAIAVEAIAIGTSIVAKVVGVCRGLSITNNTGEQAGG